MYKIHRGENEEIISILCSPYIHLAFALLFGFIIAATGLYFIVYKKLIKEKIVKNLLMKMKEKFDSKIEEIFFGESN
jgi:hypothetical protein